MYVYGRMEVEVYVYVSIRCRFNSIHFCRVVPRYACVGVCLYVHVNFQNVPEFACYA